jgi:hypothetical protein
MPISMRCSNHFSFTPLPHPQFPSLNPPIIHTGKVGRPSYSINIDKAEELRWNGATWEDVASYFNVTSRTLFRHMKREGRPTRRPYDDISKSIEQPYTQRRISVLAT